MKFMKLGTGPDTFYMEEAIRTVISDAPSDLTITINNITYLLHKIPLVPKCGLLQRLISCGSQDNNITLDLHDIPGGENAFELCAKICYGIAISLGAHNFVSAFCAAKFLGMTESVEEGNLVLKLEAFFNSCILEGWKDSIVALQSTGNVAEWSENLGIIRRCIDSIVEKILKPPSQVRWSYTYTRPGYDRKRHQSVPRDWWTEDVSELDIHLFRCVIAAVRSTNMLPSQLIGEALHVYACRWLPELANTKSSSASAQTELQAADRRQRILEMVVSMIPPETGSVSVGFLFRLVRASNILSSSPETKSELVRRSGQQFEEATLNELLLPSNHHSYDIDLVRAMLTSFLRQQRRRKSESERSIVKVGKLIDSYLQVVARVATMPVQKVVSLAAALPEIARPNHDELYKAINIYLKDHPNLTKAEKKELCRILDCQKLSPEVRSHAVRNEQLPLRTVVQVLFSEQERGTGGVNNTQKLSQEDQLPDRQHRAHSITDLLTKSKATSSKQSIRTEGGSGEAVHHRLEKSEEREAEKGKEIREEEVAGNPSKISQKKAGGSQHSHSKGRKR